MEALSLAGRATMAAETIGDSVLTARCQLVGGWLLLRLGKHGEALKRFNLARQVGRDYKSPSLNGVLAKLGEAEALCLMDNPDSARIELIYSQAAAELGRLEPSLEASFLLALGQSKFFRRLGETGRALEEAQNAVELASGMNDGWQVAVGKLNLAAAGIWAGGESLDAGLKLLEEAEAVFDAWRDGYNQALVVMWRFFGHFQSTGEPGNGIMQRCLAAFRTYPSLLGFEKELGRFILLKAQGETSKVTLTAEKVNPVPERRTQEQVNNPPVADTWEGAGCPETQAAAVIPPGLRIFCLGEFRVYRGDELLEHQRWPRRKCKTLLKFLALHLGQKVPKDAVIDLLWPDLPAEKASNAFYVTIHALRKILGAGLPREVEYIASRSGMIYLEPGLVENLDVEEFNQACTLAFNQQTADPAVSLTNFEKARRLYRGDLLSEDLYEIWPSAFREKLRQQYLKVMAALAEKRDRAGRPVEALELWQELIEHDPFNETGQQEVIRLLLLQDQQTAARRQFLKYKHLLKKEVGVEPGEEITKLYSQCLKKAALIKRC